MNRGISVTAGRPTGSARYGQILMLLGVAMALSFAALAMQGLLYQRMTGDASYCSLVAAHIDWLFGRNPWGTSMFTGIPEGGVFPRDPHLGTTNLTGRMIRGGVVDGPVAESIFSSLKGVALSRADPFAPFQAERAVYHDDMKDYSTNEPTMDGTASAVLLLALASVSH